MKNEKIFGKILNFQLKIKVVVQVSLIERLCLSNSMWKFTSIETDKIGQRRVANINFNFQSLRPRIFHQHFFKMTKKVLNFFLLFIAQCFCNAIRVITTKKFVRPWSWMIFWNTYLFKFFNLFIWSPKDLAKKTSNF